MAIAKSKAAKPKKAASSGGADSSTASKTATSTKTATATKTSTDAYTQGNITVTGGAGAGATHVTIGLPGGSLANNSKEPAKAKAKDSDDSKPVAKKAPAKKSPDRYSESR